MAPEVTTSVFVYGTLKPGGHYHEAYCGGFQLEATDGYIQGRLFHFPDLGYPGALESVTDKIYGVLLTFNHEKDLVLSKLDQLEGYDPARPAEDNEYYRKLVTVYNESDLTIMDNAWCYFMTPEQVRRLNGAYLPSGIWPG